MVDLGRHRRHIVAVHPRLPEFEGSGGGDEDRAEAAGKTARARPRQVDVAGRLAVDEGRDGIGPRLLRAPEPQQHVVVAVEHRLEGQGSGFGPVLCPVHPDLSHPCAGSARL